MNDKPLILVVDDDPYFSRLEQLYLEKEGYEVKLAADGNEAIDAFRKLPPDLVLLDVMLPGLSFMRVPSRLIQNSQLRTPLRRGDPSTSLRMTT